MCPENKVGGMEKKKKRRRRRRRMKLGWNVFVLLNQMLLAWLEILQWDVIIGNKGIYLHGDVQLDMCKINVHYWCIVMKFYQFMHNF
jgi:hypothetical protein